MKKSVFYGFCAGMFLLFIAEKLYFFILTFDELEFVLGSLFVILPQTVVLVGSFVGEYFLIKHEHFEPARVIGGIKYVAVLLLYLCNIGWAAWEFVSFFYSFIGVFIVWFPIGMIAEPIIIYLLERKSRKDLVLAE